MAETKMKKAIKELFFIIILLKNPKRTPKFKVN